MAGSDTGKDQAAPKKVLKSGVSPDVGKATQFQPGVSGNPAGKPKGTLSLSEHIKNLLNDEEFTTLLPDPRDGWKEQKGAPVKAIVKTATIRAIQGEKESREWLAKYGYGTKLELETSGEVTHKWEELDDDELDRIIKAKQDRIS